MSNRPAVAQANWWIAAIIVVAIAAGVVALVWNDRSGEQGSGLADRFDYEIEQYEKIDPALFLFEETGQIATGLQDARGVAIGPEDRIYVAGDEAVCVFEPSGTLRSKLPLDGEPTCLAVGGADHAFPGRTYAAVGRAIEVLDAEGNPAGTWELPGEKARPTGIALAGEDVFVADCGGRVVLRYSTSGDLLGRIGRRDPDRGVPGFVIPSPFFDVAVAAREDDEPLLWVINPGARRLEAYTFDGTLELFWGESSADVEGFFGCCNPAYFALLPDGSFVTAEKGLLRVKVYTVDGQFEGVLAGPEQLDSGSGPATAAGSEGRFDHEYKAVDVAADRRGRVLILDFARALVRVYERKEPAGAEDDNNDLDTSDADAD